ncbi:MAG: hypothetical protein WCP30_04630 [Mycobacteriaceae bacterium]
MHDVNWWLMALAFMLGLLLTFLLMIGRVTREVPVMLRTEGVRRSAFVVRLTRPLPSRQ